jgi:hypothetical protein
MAEIVLTVPQKRAIYATLRLFEKALLTADDLLADGEVVGSLYVLKSSLSREQSQMIRARIRKALQDTAAFADTLNFGPSEDSVEQTIMGDMSICWENLEECRSRQLRGYGEMDQKTGELIDRSIENLSNLAIEISNMVAPNKGQARKSMAMKFGKNETEE